MWLLDKMSYNLRYIKTIKYLSMCICLVAQLYKEIMDTETNTQRFFVL